MKATFAPRAGVYYAVIVFYLRLRLFLGGKPQKLGERLQWLIYRSPISSLELRRQGSGALAFLSDRGYNPFKDE